MRVDNIALEGYTGTWYIVDNIIMLSKHYYLLESEIYGDEVPSIIIDSKYNIILDNVYNGWDDLRYHLGID